MSLSEKNPFARDRQAAGPETIYPAEFHFRIIVEPQFVDGAQLEAVLTGYRVTAPLAPSRQSSGGRYQAYSLSVTIGSREELDALDVAVKKVPGVRMVL